MFDVFTPLAILSVTFAVGFLCCMALVKNSVMSLERRVRQLEQEISPHPLTKMPPLIRPRYISVNRRQRA